jgi:putative flippase GtrA
MKNTIKKHADKLRFGLVGVINTAIDFSILFTLVGFGLPTIVSNFFSTSVALTFSFFANRSFTFKYQGKNSARQIVLFLVITTFGLWVIQPLIITGASWALNNISSSKYLVLFISKLLAVCASLVWNYSMYRRFVFGDNQSQPN